MPPGSAPAWLVAAQRRPIRRGKLFQGANVVADRGGQAETAPDFQCLSGMAAVGGVPGQPVGGARPAGVRAHRHAQVRLALHDLPMTLGNQRGQPVPDGLVYRFAGGGQQPFHQRAGRSEQLRIVVPTEQL
ncbi:MAG: hypothetical protein ACRDS0_37110, partial [Pseudonocardiaceae bacterium]